MRHPRLRPSVASSGIRLRLAMMVTLLCTLGLMIYRARDPATWSWLVPPAQREAEPQAAAETPFQETIRPGPTDKSDDEQLLTRRQLQAVLDKTPMQPEEMPAYWRLMKWANAQSSQELHRRAQHPVFFTQLWEQPDKYRGQLVELKLHVRRILSHEAPKNSAGVDRVYELWGWTDESRSHPYVVVVAELPPGLSEGADLYDDVMFRGYFLKVLRYEAADAQRGAPLLIGRVERRENPARAALQRSREDNTFWPTVLVGGAAVLLMIGWQIRRGSRSRKKIGMDRPLVVPPDPASWPTHSVESEQPL